jgi:hypothetical protein
MVAFGAALIMNGLTLAFERDSTKMKCALLACYINVLAGACGSCLDAGCICVWLLHASTN